MGRRYNIVMLSKLKSFANARPKLASWLFLAVGMVVILIIAAPKDGTLTPGNWVFLILATIGLAGLCAWIISWEDGEDDAEDSGKAAAAETEPAPRGPKTPAAGASTQAEEAGGVAHR